MNGRGRRYTPGEVEALLFASHGRPTTFGSGQPGHATSEHVYATRERMREHAMDVVQVSTAFLPARAQQVAAATAVLNHHQGQGALGYLDTIHRPGIRVIVETPMLEITVRCADAVKTWTELAGAACMVIDRTHDGIHIQTLYPIRYFNAADPYGRRPMYRRDCPSWWTGSGLQYDIHRRR